VGASNRVTARTEMKKVFKDLSNWDTVNELKSVLLMNHFGFTLFWWSTLKHSVKYVAPAY